MIYRILYKPYFLFILIITNITSISASPWLPNVGNYKYHFSILSIDQQSQSTKAKRVKSFVEIQKIINELTRQQHKLSPQSTRYLQLQKNIDHLNKQRNLLTTYNDEQIYSSGVEYGINNKSSIGIKVLYKNNEFNTKSQTTAADIFYKIKLLHNDRYIFSIQPQIYVTKDTNSSQELFYETAALIGTTYTKDKVTFIIDSAFALGNGINISARKKRYYSVAISETIKLPYGFMLNNFSKYYIRNNYDATYNKTIYEQLSIAKEINFGKNKQNNLTLQLGYFWDRSLNYAHYKISGTIFSIWTEI